jgi:hypothetical protein
MAIKHELILLLHTVKIFQFIRFSLGKFDYVLWEVCQLGDVDTEALIADAYDTLKLLVNRLTKRRGNIPGSTL